MDLDHILLWMTGLSCGLLTLRLGLKPSLRRSGWFRLSLGLLVALAALHLALPGRAGLIVGPVWALVIMLPLLLSSAMQRATVGGRYGTALMLSRLVALLHPMDGMTRYPRLVRGLKLLNEGHIEEAQELLDALGRGSVDPLARSARVLLARAEGDWQSILDWVGEDPWHPLLSDPAVLAGALQAYGETGRPAEMLALYRARAASPDGSQPGLDQAVTPLIVAAMVGRLDLVKTLLTGAASVLAPSAQDFWHATALQVSGDPEAAIPLLERARVPQGALLNREIEQRLARPLPPVPEDLADDDTRAFLDGLVTRLVHEKRFAPLSGGGGGRPLGTLALALLLLGVFALQLPGGPTDYDNLVAMGALLVPVELTPGEWWRRISAGFLHFGWMHLSMNLAGLLLLGTWLERAWGPRRLTATFLICTLTSLALYPLVSEATLENPQILVGASGGIMGLLGALLGWLLVGRTQGGNAAVSSQLRTMLLLVGVQVLFDLNTPMVSQTAHLLGLGTGLVLGLALGRRALRRGETVA